MSYLQIEKVGLDTTTVNMATSVRLSRKIFAVTKTKEK